MKYCYPFYPEEFISVFAWLLEPDMRLDYAYMLTISGRMEVICNVRNCDEPNASLSDVASRIDTCD